MAIGVVIVTFNRLKKLKKALKSFDTQTVKPDYIIVVNNASTDGTLEYLLSWKDKKNKYSKYLITTPKNLGGSGGFYTGLKFAQNLNSNWIWVSDDDAFPENNALEMAEKYLNRKYSAVCGAVINNGKLDLIHRRIFKLTKFRVITKNIPEEMYKRDKFQIDFFTYVGTIINKEKLKLVGLPRKEYFICYDDTEHSLRLRKVGKIICAPSVKIHHDTNISNTNMLSWKMYYEYRNQTDMYKRSFSRRYYYYYCGMGLLKSTINIIINRYKENNKMKKRAIMDGMKGKMGINSIYKPGWKPNYKK